MYAYYSNNRNTLYKSVFKHRRLKSHRLIWDFAVNCNRTASWPDKMIPCHLSLCFPCSWHGLAEMPGLGHFWESRSGCAEARHLRLQTVHSSLKQDRCDPSLPWTPQPGFALLLVLALARKLIFIQNIRKLSSDERFMCFWQFCSLTTRQAGLSVWCRRGHM